MWYLIVSIPDLCNLTYFTYTNQENIFIELVSNKAKEATQTDSNFDVIPVSKFLCHKYTVYTVAA